MLDIAEIRRQFPILNRTIGGHPLIYLDSAATTQKPKSVLDAMRDFYENHNGNVHRGMHILAEESTVAYENARKVVQQFLGAANTDEVIFTKNCTEAINLVARSLSKEWRDGDAVVLSTLEHHSNIVPWQQLCERKGTEIFWVDIDDAGQMNLAELEKHLHKKSVKLVSITGLSNVLGVLTPLKEIIAKAHDAGALVLVDAAQLSAHAPIDVQKLDCDFLTFSGHKLYGPLGIGVLYGKREILKNMPPFLGGGMMIGEVHEDHFTPADPPARFEAGTPPIAEAVGLAAAIEWLGRYSWKDIQAHESTLLIHAAAELQKIPGLHLLPILNSQFPILNSPHSCLSFTIDDIHPHDLTDILGKKGICLRAGHHCAQPLHRRLGITASTRLSVGIYNTKQEISTCISAIAELAEQWLTRK
jgi:cysteine desulfurase/selenocysteine lyase